MMSAVGDPPIPILSDAHDELLQLARQLLADREAGYPAAVEAGTITAEQAADGIRRMRAIAADWQRIADLNAGRDALPIDRTAARSEKILTLETAIPRLDRDLMRWKQPVLDALPASLMEKVRDRSLDHKDLRDLYAESGSTIAVIPAYITAERRLWLAEALLWHYQRDAIRPWHWQNDLFFAAEFNAETIRRARQRASEAA